MSVCKACEKKIKERVKEYTGRERKQMIGYSHISLTYAYSAVLAYHLSVFKKVLNDITIFNL
jgi:hypothetical protein